MERLSALDAEFLHLEDGVAHMHIAGLSVFDGPPPALDDLVGLVAAKLHLIPRYRQRVRFVPFELGRPVWVDDPHFDLGYHLRHAALPAPGDDAALCRLMARLMSQPLDRDRPLWETWLVDGLPDGRWALITKIHHCMVDGIAGVELLTVLLEIERDAPLPEPEPWTASPRPSRPVLVLDAGRGVVGELGTWARRMPGAIRDPAATVRSARRIGEGLVRLGRDLAGTPPLSIEGTIGPHRVWAHSSARLDDVGTIRRAFGGTVNDVVLAAVTGGYRALLLARGEDTDQAVVRSLVPISTRTEGAHGLLDNRVSALLLELPVHVADPVSVCGPCTSRCASSRPRRWRRPARRSRVPPTSLRPSSSASRPGSGCARCTGCPSARSTPSPRTSPVRSSRSTASGARCSSTTRTCPSATASG